jgi:hypothetical protein
VSAASGASVAPSKASHIQGHHAQQPSRERGPSRLCGEGGEADLDQSENDRVRGTYAEQRCKAPFGKRPEKRRRRAACIHPETARVRMKSSDPAKRTQPRSALPQNDAQATSSATTSGPSMNMN